jgi:hypothetical protein
MMQKLLWSGSLAFASLILSSCAYLAPPKPTGHTAVVRSGPWGAAYRGGYVEMVSVSGVDPSLRLHSAMTIAPGETKGLVYVYLCNGGAMDCNNSIAAAEVSFHAEADHTYRVHAREQVNGSDRFWVWVEDESDGKVVGGTQPNSGSREREFGAP